MAQNDSLSTNLNKKNSLVYEVNVADDLDYLEQVTFCD